jgi:hypothetical protein
MGGKEIRRNSAAFNTQHPLLPLQILSSLAAEDPASMQFHQLRSATVKTAVKVWLKGSLLAQTKWQW